MGATQENPDIEMVVDYALKKHFVRLHLDLPLQPRTFDAVKALMDEGKKAEALAALAAADPGAKPYLDLFFDPPKQSMK